MDTKKLYDLRKYIAEKLWDMERKVFGMMDSNKDLQAVKEAYLAQRMPQERVDRLKEEISLAKLERRRRRRRVQLRRLTTAAAALAAVFVILPNTSAGVANAMEELPLLGRLVSVVTFRNYHYEDDRNLLNVEVPELVADNSSMGRSLEVTENLKKTTMEINEEIRSITDSLVKEFEENLPQEVGYQDINVQSRVLSATEDYFALRLSCFQAMGSGAQWDYYYTIDLNTGKRLSLSELFAEDCDYLLLISEDIKRQMKEQMAADGNVRYWLEDEEIPEWNFESITEETGFYLSQEGSLVICFDEGEVAPMYMGCVEFEISGEIYQGYQR